MSLRDDFFMRLRRAPSSGASRHLLPEEGFQKCEHCTISHAGKALHGVSQSFRVPTVLKLLFACAAGEALKAPITT